MRPRASRPLQLQRLSSPLGRRACSATAGTRSPVRWRPGGAGRQSATRRSTSPRVNAASTPQAWTEWTHHTAPAAPFDRASQRPAGAQFDRFAAPKADGHRPRRDGRGHSRHPTHRANCGRQHPSTVANDRGALTEGLDRTKVVDGQQIEGTFRASTSRGRAPWFLMGQRLRPRHHPAPVRHARPQVTSPLRHRPGPPTGYGLRPRGATISP